MRPSKMNIRIPGITYINEQDSSGEKSRICTTQSLGESTQGCSWQFPDYPSNSDLMDLHKTHKTESQNSVLIHSEDHQRPFYTFPTQQVTQPSPNIGKSSSSNDSLDITGGSIFNISSVPET